ncbi:hypothetical protein CMI37_30385 [Candidatus Pacearchaeota archaeon]|nr:hypothetical protein [Candidatus Pacearchaeota archaeon]|tara:strand:- start:814 stop:1038 length:225 start_codon:yes stop_codon:yes gene_type:complete
MSDFLSLRAAAKDGSSTEDVTVNTKYIVALSPDEILGFTQVLLASGATIRAKLPYNKLCEKMKCDTELLPRATG